MDGRRGRGLSRLFTDPAHLGDLPAPLADHPVEARRTLMLHEHPCLVRLSAFRGAFVVCHCCPSCRLADVDIALIEVDARHRAILEGQPVGRHAPIVRLEAAEHIEVRKGELGAGYPHVVVVADGRFRHVADVFIQPFRSDRPEAWVGVFQKHLAAGQPGELFLPWMQGVIMQLNVC